MKLYFIVAEEGEMNLDWFVIAETAEEARNLWLSLDTVQDFTCVDEGSLEMPGIEIFDVGIQMDGPARTYDWHTDVRSVLQSEATTARC